MHQTLRSNFSPSIHRSARRNLLPAPLLASYSSLDSLMSAMQQYISQAKNELLQPRPQAVQFILQEAARLH